MPEEFEQFMRFSAGLDHHNILCYNGVFFLESLQMPLMTGSVRQYMEGRTVKCDGRKVKPKSSNGWGSMRPKVVKQVAVGVVNGLFYLHSQKVSVMMASAPPMSSSSIYKSAAEYGRGEASGLPAGTPRHIISVSCEQELHV